MLNSSALLAAAPENAVDHALGWLLPCLAAKIAIDATNGNTLCWMPQSADVISNGQSQILTWQGTTAV